MAKALLAQTRRMAQRAEFVSLAGPIGPIRASTESPDMAASGMSWDRLSRSDPERPGDSRQARLACIERDTRDMKGRCP